MDPNSVSVPQLISVTNCFTIRFFKNDMIQKCVFVALNAPTGVIGSRKVVRVDSAVQLVQLVEQ